MEISINGKKIIFADSDVMYAYHEPSVGSIGKVAKLNNVLKVPVTLMAEMVQKYAPSELPWLASSLPKDTQYVKVFKSWDEIKKIHADLVKRGIEQIPFVMPHSGATFTKEQIPSEVKAYIKDYILETEIKGFVKDFYLDETNHKLKGFCYLKITDHDPVFIANLESGKVVDVSVGFICAFAGGGMFENDEYMLSQIDMQVGHLAGLVHARGKCPAGVCGLNQDHQHSTEVDRAENQNETYLAHLVAEYTKAIHDPTPVSEGYMVGPFSVQFNSDTKTPVVPIYTSLPNATNKVDNMPETLDELKKIIADQQKLLADQQSSGLNQKIEALTKQVNDHQTAFDTMKALKDKAEETAKECGAKVKEKDAEIEQLKKTQTDEMRVKVLAEVGDTAIINGKLVKDMCHQALTIAYDTILLQKNKNTAAQGMAGKPSQEDHDKKITGNDSKNTPANKVSTTVSAADLLELGKAK